MKKLFAILLAVAICLSLGTAAFAAEDVLLIAPAPAAGVNVYVTISDAGELAITQAPVYVTDLDADGVVSIHDAVIAAHEAYYEDGAAGFVSYESSYGISIDKLWGVENGGSYMYYLNDAMSLNMADPVSEGDYITAYGFEDLENWSDMYSFFDKRTAETETNKAFELTLNTLGWDGVPAPFEGAVIYINGEATDIVTKASGKASIGFGVAGTYVVSAKSFSSVIVPPVCTVTVVEAAAPVETPEAPVSADTYTVKAGDTYGTIALNNYGTYGVWKQLYKANDGAKLAAGATLTLPETLGKTARIAAAAAAEGETLYTVKGGDTLGSIAQTVYGNSKLYTAIFERNADRLLDANTIFEGQIIVLPAI